MVTPSGSCPAGSPAAAALAASENGFYVSFALYPGQRARVDEYLNIEVELEASE